MLIIVLLISIIAIYWLHRYQLVVDAEEHLTGLWLGDPKFMADAQIASMELLIDKPSASGQRAAVLTIDGEIADAFDMSYTLTPGVKSTYYCKLSSDNVFPTDCTIVLDKHAGYIVVYADDTIYGVMYRDNATRI